MKRPESSPAPDRLTPSEISSLREDARRAVDRLDELDARKGLPPVKRARHRRERQAQSAPPEPPKT